MNRVTIELWLGLRKELGRDFQSPSEMRSIRGEWVEEGTTIRQLLDGLVRRYPPLSRVVFDRESRRLYPNVVVNYNDSVISPYVVHDQILKDGDKITVLPVYMGG
jgi:molybdopterin converting factor small subunit